MITERVALDAAELSARESLQGYLETVRRFRRSSATTELLARFTYHGAEDFLLQVGRWYVPRPYTLEWRGVERNCYGNAILAAIRYGLRYVEGYAVAVIGEGGHFPCLHAWNADDDGIVFDPTWRTVGAAYLGVEFSIERAHDANQAESSILDDWTRRSTLFEKPWTGENFTRRYGGTSSSRLRSLRAHITESKRRERR